MEEEKKEPKKEAKKEPLFRTQFNASQFERKKKVGFYEALPGFVPGQAESISRLVQRLSVGQSVTVYNDGVYSDAQVFDTEMTDKFDYFDKGQDLERQYSAAQAAKAAENPPETAPPPSQE